ncbi:MAG: SDR family NAD(P)-dependent oxidoreductase [Chlorogloeopsis fritschii C42_A2020_084]|uniref:SDR family NAD(P)-dependent oxidoreductase n=1 Tax=Chlorogloeopsis fritschii TaxID=1124 RepID=UPI001A0D2675|nr:SDR family NAD(P)-dependent oxidoreductase [Chlorogloeopsis fritschii]MBF2008246.1 SDR family NAD(P)-dependent oxidoreductase [Chlorogloeopsis fritschii C42_A2020_084]
MSILKETNNALIVGASQGIGLGFVKKLLQLDNIARIYATYRHQESASELIALMGEHPKRLVCLPMDITDEVQISRCVEQLRAEIDKLHLVINCVGILHEGTLQPEKSLRQINSEQLVRYFQVNSIGAVLLAKHLLPLFRHHDESIFASISAKVGSIGDNQLGGWYGYRASKAALNMFMRNVAIEYGRTSPKTIVVTLHPGTTDTRLSQPFQKNVPAEKLFSVERTVTQLLAVLEKLQPDDSGQFFSWDGSRLPW